MRTVTTELNRLLKERADAVARADELQALVSRIRQMHRGDSVRVREGDDGDTEDIRCGQCGAWSPCPTLDVLEGNQ